LEDTHITLRRTKSAQANNERITFVSALDQRNKQGYDVLLFRPPASTGKRAKAVTLYEGQWHELEHDSITKKPYLGATRPDIHEFDGESLPSDNEQVPESPDEEPMAPRPQSEDSSNDKPIQHYTLPTEQTATPPVAPRTADTYYGREPQELLPANTHCSSITTLSQEQQPTAIDMVTQTIATTAAMTTV